MVISMENLYIKRMMAIGKSLEGLNLEEIGVNGLKKVSISKVNAITCCMKFFWLMMI